MCVCVCLCVPVRRVFPYSCSICGGGGPGGGPGGFRPGGRRGTPASAAEETAVPFLKNTSTGRLACVSV